MTTELEEKHMLLNVASFNIFQRISYKLYYIYTIHKIPIPALTLTFKYSSGICNGEHQHREIISDASEGCLCVCAPVDGTPPDFYHVAASCFTQVHATFLYFAWKYNHNFSKNIHQ